MKKKFSNEQVREKLLARRSELISESAKASSLTNDFNDVRDIADEAYAISSQKLQRSIGEADINEIKLIDLALARIEEGMYGVCLDCEGEISEARLNYYPYAVRCILCQEAYDA